MKCFQPAMAYLKIKPLLVFLFVFVVTVFMIVQRSKPLNKGLFSVERDVLEKEDPFNAQPWKANSGVNQLNQLNQLNQATSVLLNLPFQKAQRGTTAQPTKMQDNEDKNVENWSMMEGSLKKTKLKVYKWFYSAEEKESKWAKCKRLIAEEKHLNKGFSLASDDFEILESYSGPYQRCGDVLHARFGHPPVTEEETQLPIAYGFTIYKDSRLFERILQAIYMPHNVYCIHIDNKSPLVFHRAIKAMIACLPNVFVSKKSADVFWGHFSIVQAQLNCMDGLVRSSVKWKYYISLTGQDFPLYDNKEIVRALRGLKNYNNIISLPLTESAENRTKFVHSRNEQGRMSITNKSKSPPPHDISVFKGSTHIIATREFVGFVLHSQLATDFREFLKDTYIPDETIYASLQRHPGVPGGIHGRQPMSISRALHWLHLNSSHQTCHGKWIRRLCWITFGDLQWALGEEKKHQLFVHKIPFDFSEELLECILVARQGRMYPSVVWNQNYTKRKSNRKNGYG